MTVGEPHAERRHASRRTKMKATLEARLAGRGMSARQTVAARLQLCRSGEFWDGLSRSGLEPLELKLRAIDDERNVRGKQQTLGRKVGC